MLEIDLVILDPTHGERELHLEGSDVRVDLVGAREVDPVQLAQDLVALVDVTLVELVVRLDGGTRDAVELVQLGLELPRGDLVELERERRHFSLPWT